MELNAEQMEQLKALEGRPVALSDVPELTVEDFGGAVKRRLSSNKQAVRLPLNADVLALAEKPAVCGYAGQ